MSFELKRLTKLATTSRSDTDLALFHAWKKNPSDANASALLNQVAPLIHKEASKWSGTLAKPLMETEGKRLAMHAFSTYDPKYGTTLSTHLVNNLQKMSRLAYSNASIARLPENQMLVYSTFNNAHSSLEDALGRAPTTDELADHLAWPMKKVEEYRKLIGRKELLESGGLFESSAAGLYAEDKSDHMVDFIYHELTPPHKIIFEHLTGYAGAPILSNQEIQKKLGMTQGVYSYNKANLIQHVKTMSGDKD